MANKDLLNPFAVGQFTYKFDSAIDLVAINPFVMSLEINGLALDEPDGSPFLTIERIFVNFQLSSLFRWAFTFREFHIESPEVRLARVKPHVLEVLRLDGVVELLGEGNLYGGHARHEMLQGDVLGQVVVSAEPQARYLVNLAVARRQEDDRQVGRARPQLAAQLEAPFGILAQPDIDDGEVRAWLALQQSSFRSQLPTEIEPMGTGPIDDVANEDEAALAAARDIVPGPVLDRLARWVESGGEVDRVVDAEPDVEHAERHGDHVQVADGHRRERGGQGQIVDTAIYESVFNMLEGVVPEFDGAGVVREPSGTTVTGIVPSVVIAVPRGALRRRPSRLLRPDPRYRLLPVRCQSPHKPSNQQLCPR